MTKDKLLETIANNGYNIGFGTKKNFASYDIVTKLSSWIGFIILAVGNFIPFSPSRNSFNYY